MKPKIWYKIQKTKRNHSKQLKSGLDILWSKTIKARDKYACCRCHKFYDEGSKGINAHHIFSRVHNSTRFSLLNGVTLCVGCHRFAHREPLIFHRWLEKKIGTKRYEYLQFLKNQVVKLDYGMTRIVLESELKKCQTRGANFQ